MEKCLVAIVCLLSVFCFCIGSPVSIYDNDFDSIQRNEVDNSRGPPLLVVVFILSAVVASIAVFCTWCRLRPKISQTLNNNGILPVPLHNEDERNDRGPSTEFTIFPPDSGRHLVDQLGSENVKFEPLPDIRPRRQLGVTNLVKPRPATFNNVVSKGLSFQDWFEDPHSNFPRTQLQYVRELGSGWFGQVVEGEAFDIITMQKKSKVVVKILTGAANTTDQMYFLHEVKPFRDLNHPNVLRLLGKCLENDPFLIILEHCAFKDLKSYLIRHRTESESLLQQNLLLRMACNVAAGLQYLHEHGFILTDLAARNCLVTSDLIVKVGDYGNGIELFKDDYYCAGGIAVPVRWCAPETLHCTEAIMELKEVTQDANIWSFGVVLWEILEFGKLPYMELSDDELIQKVVIERSEQLKKPFMPCSHLDRLFQIIQLCQLSQNCRPNMDRIHAMLIHLNSNPDVGRNASSDFEARWNDLNPRRSPSKSASSSVDWNSSEFDHTFCDKFFSSPHPSLSCDSDFQQSVTSPSLQNLRGSLDDFGSSGSAVDILSSEHSHMPFVNTNLNYAVVLSSSVAVQQLLSSNDGSRSSEKEVSPFTREVAEVIRKLDEDLEKEYPMSGGFTDGERDLSEDTRNDCSLLSDNQYVSSTCSEVGLESLGEIINAGPISIHVSPVELDDNGAASEGGGYRSSLSEEEDASWKKIVESSHEESGEITRIIREKSQSVQDFLKLTVIDSESGSDSDGVPQGSNCGGDSCSLVTCPADDQNFHQRDEQLQVWGITSSYLGDTGFNDTSCSVVGLNDGDGICVPSVVEPLGTAVRSSHAAVTDCSSITTNTTIYQSDASTTTHTLPALENLAWNLVRSAAEDALQDASLCVESSVMTGIQHHNINELSIALGNVGCSELTSRSFPLSRKSRNTKTVEVFVPDIVVEEVPFDPPSDDENAVEETASYQPKSNLNFRFVFKNLGFGYDDYFSEVRSSVEGGSELGENCVNLAAAGGGGFATFFTPPKSVTESVPRQRTSTPHANDDNVDIDLSLGNDVFSEFTSDVVSPTNLMNGCYSKNLFFNDVFEEVSSMESVNKSENVASVLSGHFSTVKVDNSGVNLVPPTDHIGELKSGVNSDRLDDCSEQTVLPRCSVDTDSLLIITNASSQPDDAVVNTLVINNDCMAAENTDGDCTINSSSGQEYLSVLLSHNIVPAELNDDVLSSDEGFEASEIDDPPCDDNPVDFNTGALDLRSNSTTDAELHVSPGDNDENEEFLLVDLETNEAILMDGARPKSQLSFSSDALEQDVEFNENPWGGFNVKPVFLAATDSSNGIHSDEFSHNESIGCCSSRSSQSELYFYEEGTKDSTDASSSSDNVSGSKRGSDSSNYSQSTEDEFDFMKNDSKLGNDDLNEVKSVVVNDELTTVQLRRTSTRNQRDNQTRFQVHKIPEETLNSLAQLSSLQTINSDSTFSVSCSSHLPEVVAETTVTVTSPQDTLLVVAASESSNVKDIKVEELQLCKSSAPLIDLNSTLQECDVQSSAWETCPHASLTPVCLNCLSPVATEKLHNLCRDALCESTTTTITASFLDPVMSLDLPQVVVTSSDYDGIKNIKVEELQLCTLSSPPLDVCITAKEGNATSPVWESGTDSSSSSSCLSPSSSTSGEFDCSKSIGYNVYMEERDPDAWKEDEESNADDELHENENNEEVEPFQVSSWNKNLTPTKGLLRSPYKRHRGDEKKAVTFKFSKRSVIYEYPKEEVEEEGGEEEVEELDDDGRPLWSFQVYGSTLDYSNYADWELASEEIPDDILGMDGFEDGNDNSDEFVSPSNHNHKYSVSGAHQLYKLSNIGDEEMASGYSSEGGVATSYYAHPDSFDFATYLAHYNAENPYNGMSGGNQSADEDFWLETILNTNDFFANGGDGPLEFSVDSLDPNELPHWALNPATINMYVGGDDDSQQYDGYEDEHNTEETDEEEDGTSNDTHLIDFEADFEAESGTLGPDSDVGTSDALQVPCDKVGSREPVESSPTVVTEAYSMDNNLDNIVHLANGVTKDNLHNGNKVNSALISDEKPNNTSYENLPNAVKSIETTVTMSSNSPNSDSDWQTPVRKVSESNIINRNAALVVVENGSSVVLR